MVTLIMPSDYGIEVLVSSSPVMTGSFLGGGSPRLSDYNRCAPMWSHSPSASCLDLTSATTVQANTTTPIKGFCEAAQSIDSSWSNKTNEGLRGSFHRSGSLRGSRRKKAVFEHPNLQNLKSCLICRDEQVSPQEEEGPPSLVKGKKKVSFADATGGNLINIKLIKERSDVPPRWSREFLEQLTGGANAEPVVGEEWALAFSQPIANYVLWKNKLEKNNIALENVTINQAESLLIGSVKVRNLSFEKCVFVRYTTNNWLSYDDIEATYVSSPSFSSSYNVYDNFSFQIPLPSSQQADKVEFCLKYCINGSEYWENNNNKNYAVVAFKSKKTETRSKPREIFNLTMESWSEFSAWKNLDLCGSPYW